MYIGIIGAMEVETKKILENMENIEEINIGPFKYYTGKLFNKDLVLCTSLEGKVNSAICTQIMILNFDVEKIINIGVAGGLSKNLDIGGIAISNATVEFDQDTTALGYKLGYTFGLEEVVIKCDEFANDIYEIAKKDNNAVCGVIASSDKFVTDESTKKMLVNDFDAVAVDMESASINHVCKINNISFCAIRGISDSGSNVEYIKFVEYATERINKVLFEYIKSC
jgi:adenosylhomocysteine nucleosidase